MSLESFGKRICTQKMTDEKDFHGKPLKKPCESVEIRQVCVQKLFPPCNVDLENLCYTARMATIRASDIGNYLYCRRAWWYRKQGVESENQVELAAGTQLHQSHGRQVLASGLTRTLGFILLLVAVVILVAYLTAQIL
jgi:hypothetical protein